MLHRSRKENYSLYFLFGLLKIPSQIGGHTFEDIQLLPVFRNSTGSDHPVKSCPTAGVDRDAKFTRLNTLEGMRPINNALGYDHQGKPDCYTTESFCSCYSSQQSPAYTWPHRLAMFSLTVSMHRKCGSHIGLHLPLWYLQGACSYNDLLRTPKKCK